MRSALLALFAVGAVAVAAGRADAGTGAALVRYLPDNVTEVMVIDVAHARTGTAVGRVLQQLRAHSPRWDAVGASGVDLEHAIDTYVAAATPDKDSLRRHTIVIVDGMVGALVAHMKTDATPSTRHAGITVWTVEGGELAILDRHLVLTSPGDMAGVIDRAHKKSGNAATSANAEALRAVLGATAGSGADVWGGAILDARDRAGAAQMMGGEPLWIAFALAVSARGNLDVQIALADDATAHAVTDSLQHLLVGPDAQVRPALQTAIGAEFADSLAVEQLGTRVRLSGALTAEEADQLGNLLGSGL